MNKELCFVMVATVLRMILPFNGFENSSINFDSNRHIESKTNIPFEIQKEDGSSAVENVDYKVEGITIIFNKSGKYKIIGNGKELTDKAAFKVENNFEGDITLKNVKINLNGRKTAFKVESDAKLTLWIEGDNSLRTGDYTAAIEFMNAKSGYLIIDSKDINSSLWVLGWQGAAIGSSAKAPWESDDIPRNVSNIEIRGGNIKATSMVRDGTAIGVVGNDSMFSEAKPMLSNLVISGGKVTVECNKTECVGIGVGKSGRLENLKITGGNINAEGYGSSAAIGTGDMASIGSIEITGGNITAIAHGDGAAIGSGTDGKVEHIDISGGNIKAISKGISTAIGVGPKRYNKYPVALGTLKISGGTIESITNSSDYGIGAIKDEQINILQIDGGSLKVSKIPKSARNNEGKELALLTLKNMNNVDSINISGNDMKISGNYFDDSNLYFYVPKGFQEVKIKNKDQSEIVKKFIWNGFDFEEEVAKKQNEWEQKPRIDNWVYKEEVKQPQGKAIYGDIEFTYSDKKEGPYKQLPSEVHAGIWFMKAEVKETSDYTGLKEIITFEVKKAKPEPIYEPDKLTGKEGEKLFTVILPSGWEWVNPNDVITKSQTSYKAKYKVDDKNYDYNMIFGYNQNGYVIRNLNLKISEDQKQNAWEKELSLDGWTYGEKANVPTATAKYGDVKFSYSDKIDGIYSDNEPINAGTWYVKATVLGNENYTGLEAIKKFIIDKANTIISITNQNMDKKYNGKEVDKPEIIKTGNSNEAMFVWYEKEGQKWNKLDNAPINVGNYKVVVSVKSDDNYNGVTEEKQFKIIKAIPTYSLPENLIIKQGEKLSSLKLPEGFTWIDGTEIAKKPGINVFKAVYTPEDNLNFETIKVDVNVKVISKTENYNQKPTVDQITVNDEIPTISASNKIIIVNDEFDPLKDVTAFDKEDGDITKNIKVIKNTVDVTKPGIYEVIYEVIDKDGKRITKTITVTVREKEVKPTVITTTTNNKADRDKKINTNVFVLSFIVILLIVGMILLIIKRRKTK